MALIDGQSQVSLTQFLGYDSIVKLLIDNGTDLNTKDEYGFTPLFTSIDFGKFLLLQKR